MKVDAYTLKGTKKESVSLPNVFAEKVNLKLLAQAIRVYEDNLHPGLRKTKTRAEVNRTGKKLYKQKGTGGARHGSRRAPIFVGGGIAHGPRPVRRILSLPLSLRKKALNMALSAKAEAKEILVLDGVDSIKKTTDMSKFLKSVGKEIIRFTLVLSDKNINIQKFTKNLRNTQTLAYKNLNSHNVFFGGLLILDADIFEKAEPANTVKKVTRKVIKK